MEEKLMEILNLKKNNFFTVDGVDYVALADLEMEGYDDVNKAYMYMIYARNKMESEKDKVSLEYELKDDTYFEFRFLQKEKDYDGNDPRFTEDNIYEITPLIPGDEKDEA